MPDDPNTEGDEMQAAIVSKLHTLMKPLQDGVKTPVTADEPAPAPVEKPAAKEPVPAPKPVKVLSPSADIAKSEQAKAEPPKTETPAEPAKPAEIPATDLPPEGASKSTKEDWNRFRALKNAEIEKRDKEIAETKRQVEAARQELEKLKSGKTSDPEFESLKKSKEELEALVERLRLEESPKFKSYFDGGIEKQIKLVRSVAGEHGDELVKLIQSPRSKERNERLRELQEELGPEGYVIGNALGEISRLQMERTEQLNNWKENSRLLRETEQREQQTMQTQTAEQRRAIAERLVSRASQLAEFNPTDPADGDHASFSTQALQFIKSAAEGQISEEDALLMPVAAMKAQYLEAIKIPRMEAELASLRQKVAEMTSASPSVSGQQRKGGTNMTHDNNDPYGANEVTRRFAELMGR